VQVRRPKPNRPGRRAFVSGKKKQNTIKATVISDGQEQPFAGSSPARRARCGEASAGPCRRRAVPWI
jgi:hypothetical protein